MAVLGGAYRSQDVTDVGNLGLELLDVRQMLPLHSLHVGSVRHVRVRQLVRQLLHFVLRRAQLVLGLRSTALCGHGFSVRAIESLQANGLAGGRCCHQR